VACGSSHVQQTTKYCAAPLTSDTLSTDAIAPSWIFENKNHLRCITLDDQMAEAADDPMPYTPCLKLQDYSAAVDWTEQQHPHDVSHPITAHRGEGCAPLYAVVEQGVFEEVKAALNCQPLTN
jgi:hypothetical protein